MPKRRASLWDKSKKNHANAEEAGETPARYFARREPARRASTSLGASPRN
jgi:hypothetical protein